MVVKSPPQKRSAAQDDPLTRRIIACAIEVHKRLGPGLFEKLYQEAMAIEMALNGLKVDRNVKIPVKCRDKPIGDLFH
jgi:GxxExxY protein